MKNIIELVKDCSVGPLQETEKGWQKEFLFPKDFYGFQGHFPESPVLPAILQILAARESILEQAGRSLRLRQISRAKFYKVISADESVRLSWTCQQKESDWICKCSLEAGGSFVSSFILTLTPDM